MRRERLSLYDTTLRDGAQTHGDDFSVEAKWLIAEHLDVLGIDYIEAGYPGANPTDTRLFAEARSLGYANLTAFGMTKRPGRSLANDPGFQALLAAKVTSICLVAKSWDFHVDVALGISLEENLAAIKDSTQAIVAATLACIAMASVESTISCVTALVAGRLASRNTSRSRLPR